MTDHQDPPGSIRKKRFPATLDKGTSAPVTSTRLWDKISATPAVSKAPLVSTVTSPQNKSTVSTSRPRPHGQVSHGAMDGARQRMVQRLYEKGVRHQAVLQAMSAVPREIFVDSALVNEAYEDTSLPIGLGQTISKPSIVARMVELLMPPEGGKLRRVLDIGTGCGYQAAILSQLVDEVYSIERLRGLHERARVNLRPLRLKNVHLIYGDGMLGFPSGAPYDAIIAAAGGESVPMAWLEQLSENGCLIAPIMSKPGVQSLIKVVRTSQGWQQYELEAVQFVPLRSGVL